MRPTATPPASRRLSSIHYSLWVVQWLLGLALVGAGVFKLSLPFNQAVGAFPWAADVPALFTMTSVLDILGGAGILLPSLLRILPRTTVVAAGGVVLLMLSSVVFYLMRGEATEIAPNVAIGIAAALVAWGRWRVAPITGQLGLPEAMTDPLPFAAPPTQMQLFQLPTGSYLTRGAFAVAGGAFGDRRKFASTAVLITHPKGDLLIDAGFGANAEAHIAMLPSFRRAPHDIADSASTQLGAAGYDRENLLGVLLTHSHWDHVSGLDSLAVPIWMTEAEERYAAASTSDPVFQAVAEGHEIRRFAFDGPAYLGFPSSFDFYGDGSVVVVPAAGHTTGSIIAFVTVPSGQRYAFIGDLTWQLEGIERRLQKPLMMRILADSDSRQVRRDMERIIALQDRMHIVPAHDTASYNGIPVLVPIADGAK